MRSRAGIVLVVFSVALLATGLQPAAADHGDDPRSANLTPLGDAPRPASFLDPGPGRANSDLAFQDHLAFQGSYDGFRVVDVADPMAPKEVAAVPCGGNQGDVGVWGDIVIRAVDRPQRLPGNSLLHACEGTDTDATAAETGFEGLQIFRNHDWRTASASDLVGAVPTDCGAHTFTIAPDPANGRLIVYISTAFSAGFAGPTPYGTSCVAPHGKIVAVAVPLADPGAAKVVNNDIVASERGCHDVAVHAGAHLLVGACRPEAVVWDISEPAAPVRLYGVTSPAVTGWHSASLTWDAQVFIMGWEPGGGAAPRCQATGAPLGGEPPQFQTDDMKSLFFYRVSDGALLGKWTLPRPQSVAENCTIHNYNVVPVAGRYVLVHGSYQSGTSVVDFTDPAKAFELAFSDPSPLVPTQLGGAWSSYWYNGLIYESDITSGLRIYGLHDELTGRALSVHRLNPQTQEFLIH